MSLFIPPKNIQCKCDGCRRTIKPSQHRETFQGHSEGNFFSKTLCEKCIKEIVEQFREHLKKKEDEALVQMAEEVKDEPEKNFFEAIKNEDGPEAV
jgi:hypothetical protein